jgi:hypothetical protein
MARSILAVLMGLLVGVLMIVLIEWAGQQLYPVPAGIDSSELDPAKLDLSKPQQLAADTEQMPMLALVFVLVAWFFGVTDGAMLAAWLAPARPWLHAAWVAGLLALAALAMLLARPHPGWFQLATPLVYLTAWAIGGRIGCMLHDRRRAGVAR